jgi:hypothetical protein
MVEVSTREVIMSVNWLLLFLYFTAGGYLILSLFLLGRAAHHLLPPLRGLLRPPENQLKQPTHPSNVVYQKCAARHLMVKPNSARLS